MPDGSGEQQRSRQIETQRELERNERCWNHETKEREKKNGEEEAGEGRMLMLEP